MNNKKNLKSIVFAMVLAAGMLSPAGAFAQKGGLLSPSEQDNGPRGLFGRGWGLFDELDLQNFGEGEDDITLQNFGETPLGSGLFILLASGAGYAAMKSRKKQNTRKNQNQK